MINIPIPPYITEHNNYNTSNNNGRIYNSTNNGTSNTTLSSSSSSSPNVGDYHRQSINTPAVATNPRLFDSIWGITTLCRIPIVVPIRSTGSSRPTLLAARQDGTLLWIDARSVETIATGILRTDSITSSMSSSSNNPMMITSMNVGPTSTMERGTLTLVTGVTEVGHTSSSGAITGGGECLLVEWSIQSTTPIQRTILKRASTGSLSVVSDNNNNTIDHPYRRRSLDDLDLLDVPSSSSSSFQPPRRTSSMGSTPGLQKTLQSVMDLASTSSGSLKESLRRGRRRKLGGDQSKEEQKLEEQQQRQHHFFQPRSRNLFPTNGIDKSSTNHIADSERRHVKGFTVPFGFMEGMVQSNGSPRARSHSTSNVTHRFEKGEDGGTEHDRPRMSRYPRRRSDPNMHNGQASTTRNMRVVILSRWSGHTDNDDDDDDHDGDVDAAGGQDHHQHGRHHRRSRRQRYHHHPKVVIDACFGSLPSVVCVIYKTTSPSSTSERRQRIAQVLAVTEAGTFKPIVSLFVTLEQIEQATSVTTEDVPMMRESGGSLQDDGVKVYTDVLKDDNDSQKMNFVCSTQSLFGLEHDGVSDNFFISSTFGRNKYWMGCVWNWRVNAIGWTIQRKLTSSLLWSRLCYSQDPYRGPHLVYIAASYGRRSGDPSQQKIELRKQSVPIGTLSPSSSLTAGIYEPSSVLLANDYISFPCANKKANGSDTLELGWMTSALPQSYVASFGAPRIAAVGLCHTKSVAVASRNGVCVLDAHNVHRHRWKQFGSPNEEKMFAVAAMTWWEGHPHANNEAKRNDLLVAITETNSGRQYLSCWSPKRYACSCIFTSFLCVVSEVLEWTNEIASFLLFLFCSFDLANQLLDTPDQEWKDNESQDPAPAWGMALPNDIKATNISILAEPTSQSLGDNNPRRAVVLVYATDLKTCQFHYVVYRLQVFQSKTSKASVTSRLPQQRPFYVMTQESLSGTLQNGTRSASPVSGIFLAGACFRYDLRTMKKKSSTAKNVDNDFVVTFGVIRTPGLIEALCLGRKSKTWGTPLIEAEVSRYWLSDIIRTNDMLGVDGPPIITFVWAIELLSGGLHSWSVPSVVCCSAEQTNDWQMEAFFKETKIARPKGLRLASLVCRKETREQKKRWLLGSLCDLGSVSDWVQQATFGSQSDIALGCVPDSLFGCILRSGQGVKRYRRTHSDGMDLDNFTFSIYQTDVYSQSPFLMTPPAFVASLYILLLESASLRTEIPVIEASNLMSMSSMLQSHQNRLKVRDLIALESTFSPIGNLSTVSPFLIRTNWAGY